MADKFAWTWTDEELETVLNAIVSIELPVVTSQSYYSMQWWHQPAAVSANATRNGGRPYSLYHRYYDCIFTSRPAAIILGILS